MHYARSMLAKRPHYARSTNAVRNVSDPRWREFGQDGRVLNPWPTCAAKGRPGVGHVIDQLKASSRWVSYFSVMWLEDRPSRAAIIVWLPINLRAVSDWPTGG